MMIAALLLVASASAQDAQPMQVVSEPRHTVPRPATSWECNYLELAGNRFSLQGRFPEAPVGWYPELELKAKVTGEAPAHFLGTKPVRVMGSTPEVRKYLMYHVAADGVRYDFDFQMLNDEFSLAIVTRYTPPSGDRLGQTEAFATGHCHAKFHAIGEREVGL